MEGSKERQRQQREEKESNEAEDDTRSDDEEADGNSERAMLDWQEGYDQDNLGLPIMHWEALSLHIAELEKQEEEKKAKAGARLERARTPVSWTEEKRKRAESWEDGSDACNSHVLALTSRLQTQMNLQLCFINNSESEEEDEEEEKKGDACTSSWRGRDCIHKNIQHPAKPDAPKSRSFRSALKKLRERLRTDHNTRTAAGREPIAQRKHLELCDLENSCVKDLKALCASLSQDIQERSSELVSRLHVRDQLRTEQDAMLLEVQDLMSL